MMRFTLVLFVLAVFAVAVPISAQSFDDPLACLADRGDMAVTWEVDGGQWMPVSAGPVPELSAVHGSFYGYGNGATWSGMYGWPNDLVAVQYLSLERRGQAVGYVWIFESPTTSLRAIFTFKTMTTGADGGQHDFCYWGELQ